MRGAKQRPRRSVGGHPQPQPREAETDEGAEHLGSGQRTHTLSCLPLSICVVSFFLRNVQNLYRLHFWICPFLHPAYKECNKRKSSLILSEFVMQVESCMSSSCSTTEDQSGRFVSPDLRHPQGSVRWRERRRPHAEAGGFGGSAILSLQVHV